MTLNLQVIGCIKKLYTLHKLEGIPLLLSHPWMLVVGNFSCESIQAKKSAPLFVSTNTKTRSAPGEWEGESLKQD